MDSVVVTGGSRGLGLAIAEGVAASGMRAVAVARTDGPALRAAMARWGDALAFCRGRLVRPGGTAGAGPHPPT